MDASSVSVLSYKRSKPLGKVRRRVQDVRVPSSSYTACLANRPALDLSHNESARLAVDCLLSQGRRAYQEMLRAEREVDFLSELEKGYILENGTDGTTDDPGACDEKAFESSSAASWSALSTDTESTVADVQVTDSALTRPSVEIYFQSDSKAAVLKDLVREFIRKASMALAIVMDVFTDVELLCDLLEASRKRNVSVYLLLDRLNLDLFVRMWQDLKLNSSDFPKLSVHSVSGQTYCAKSGRKLTGEIAENLIISDWNEVLTGSYSFSWLSWQVHRSLGVLVKGSAVTPFHQEFHRLYFSSTAVPGFVTFITLPLHTSHATHYNSRGVGESKSGQTKTTCQLAGPEDAKRQMLPGPEIPEPEHSKGNNRLLHKAAVDDQQRTKPLQNQKQVQSISNCLGQTQVSDIQSQLASLNMRTNVQELNPTHQPQRAVRYQSTLKKHLPSENPTQMVPSTSQQTKTSLHFSHSGQHPFGFDPVPSSLGPKRPSQDLTTHGYPRAGATQLNLQLRADDKMFLPGATSKLQHLQPRIQQGKLTLLNWRPQSHTVRARPVARTSSFDTSYGSGQTTAGLLDWRSSHKNMTSLGRSKSLNERCPARPNPNQTTF